DFVLENLTAKALLAQIESPLDAILVAEDHGLRGFIRTTQNCPCPVDGWSDTEISTFYVRPNSQGQGIGSALLTQALNACNAPSIWLATNSENTPAIGFYHAQGFQTVGLTHFHVEDKAYPNDVLARKL
ncbi:MAG: GNAT family N-acetyltransferase, partial [Planktomarina sp.]